MFPVAIVVRIVCGQETVITTTVADTVKPIVETVTAAITTTTTTKGTETTKSAGLIHETNI